VGAPEKLGAVLAADMSAAAGFRAPIKHGSSRAPRISLIGLTIALYRGWIVRHARRPRIMEFHGGAQAVRCVIELQSGCVLILTALFRMREARTP
jgi:hypothetical protein